VSEEEVFRTVERGNYFAILPMLPELRPNGDGDRPLSQEYSSANNPLSKSALYDVLKDHRLLVGDQPEFEQELLR
ncbi:MAG: polysaccharide biosynthesis protein, partial [Anaerolineae bacterium]|nr:polysaccharide biosynthesis protein [Anaerolineae bacterium]